MGVLVNITCMSCGADWQQRVGSGILHGDLKAVADLYPEEIKQKILLCAGQEEFPSYDFGYRLASCAKCKEVISVPVLKLGKDGKVYVGTCGQCGGTVELAERKKELSCPVCHKASLRVEETGLWD